MTADGPTETAPGATDRVVVIGGGVAGLTAATYTARHDRETVVLDGGSSLLERNAHLENVPGFPGGIDARRYLALLREQATGAGATLRETRATALAVGEAGGFAVTTAEADVLEAAAVVAATKNATDYLPDAPGLELVDRGSKRFVATDERGRTGVEGLYAAGRLAEKPHQTAVAAGHGAEVAVTVLEDADDPFYHDWVAPEGYFTGRGRDVPPGCEEIDDAERREREAAARERLRERLAGEPAAPPQQHPSVAEE